jgi:pilus assembly protein Flp/PilA
MLTTLRKLMRDGKDRGASAVEYGLMVAAIAAVIVGVVFALGTFVGDAFNNTCDNIQTAATANANANAACATP